MISASRSAAAGSASCRFCGAELSLTVVDLGMSPLCESFLSAAQVRRMESFFPLHLLACEQCYLVQLEAYVAPAEIFADYAYFSAYSASWVDHARQYVEMICNRLRLGPEDLVIELASNDGYLLQHFVGTGIPFLGIDPAANVARAAEERGVQTLVAFFGPQIARQLVGDGKRPSLIVGNNVLAQVPDLNEFVAAVQILLRDTGTATFEFPHLLRLLDGIQYDTIYHEHFSYFSLGTITEVFQFHGLEIYDVEELWTHGGSLRIYAQHVGGPHARKNAVLELLEYETEEGLRALLELLIRLRRDRKRVVGYGAPGKGNTLLNYCGIRGDFLEYTVDRNPHKQGLFTPGTHIPILAPEKIAETKPDYILVLPWNLIDEIASQLSYVAEWGGRLIVPIPRASILDV